MFNNKYAQFNSLTMLKSMRPRRAIVPKTPDFSNFMSYSPDLNRLANFGLEMMKFLPRFEQLQYADNVYMDKGEEGSVTFSHGDTSTTVSQEWWDAFNQYELTSPSDYHAFATETLTDNNGDDRITNADTIHWAEDFGHETDGFDGWRNDQNWVHGQHHRTGNFLTGKGLGGSAWGAMFKNLDFVAEGSEWNHIGVKNNAKIKNPNAAGDIDRPYFINGILSSIDSSWSEVKNLLENHPDLAGKSYYDIIMTKSYESLTDREATLFAAAMYESRERAWSMMSEVFGPVNKTRDDQAMMPYIKDFIASHNPYGNHHALSFFQFFLPIQHSVINRMTTFYERSDCDGWERAALDEVRFWEFGQWLGAETYNYIHEGVPTVPVGKLYEYRDSKSDGAKDAVQDLIDGWFGAAYVENGRPIYKGYRDTIENDTPASDAEGWVGLSSSVTIREYGNGYNYYGAVSAFVPDLDHPNYGWDRKWNAELFIKTSGGNVKKVYTRDASWAGVLAQLQQQGSVQSRMNPAMEGVPHPNYVAAQFHGLSYNGLMAGTEFASNWAVFANGMLMKWGQGLDLVRVMEKSAATRVASAKFKQDRGDYSKRKEELEDEEKLEKKGAAKRAAQRKKWHKKLQNKAKKLRKEMNGKTAGSSGGGKRNWNTAGEAKYGSKAYQQRLTKSAARIHKSTKKRKSMLDKVKQDTK